MAQHSGGPGLGIDLDLADMAALAGPGVARQGSELTAMLGE